ncbi:hypothetical protein [Actinomadura sp. WAC 06369]|uniref:hypothetical protein n=1 Tax=Actinomadura sp. WAC 06369 TaxID=2203193 RepID=UPI000F792FE6|nr:hypothetical protein [Actinomadura sp. WAC 06369]RSN72137.1 hypothetical protein DMH08_01145 [Actinomadura sp. WAC 06369]
MAEGAYASQVGWLRTRLGASWSGFSPGTDDFGNARLAAAGVPMELRRRIRRDQVVATRRAAAAVDHLFEHSGGEVVRLGNPVEQAWRNIHTTQAHALNDLDRTLVMYVAGELAVDVHPPMV